MYVMYYYTIFLKKENDHEYISVKQIENCSFAQFSLSTIKYPFRRVIHSVYPGWYKHNVYPGWYKHKVKTTELNAWNVAKLYFPVYCWRRHLFETPCTIVFQCTSPKCPFFENCFWYVELYVIPRHRSKYDNLPWIIFEIFGIAIEKETLFFVFVFENKLLWLTDSCQKWILQFLKMISLYYITKKLYVALGTFYVKNTYNHCVRPCDPTFLNYIGHNDSIYLTYIVSNVTQKYKIIIKTWKKKSDHVWFTSMCKTHFTTL